MISIVNIFPFQTILTKIRTRKILSQQSLLEVKYIYVNIIEIVYLAFIPAIYQTFICTLFPLFFLLSNRNQLPDKRLSLPFFPILFQFHYYYFCCITFHLFCYHMNVCVCLFVRP